MPPRHTWTFKASLRSAAFGWRGSHLARQRLNEAVGAIGLARRHAFERGHLADQHARRQDAADVGAGIDHLDRTGDQQVDLIDRLIGLHQDGFGIAR